jgi:hypothetical protein
MKDESLEDEIEKVRTDEDFMNRVKQIVERDKEILDELAK